MSALVAVALRACSNLTQDLNRALVDRLPPGCKLTVCNLTAASSCSLMLSNQTIFDCCHSGTALGTTIVRLCGFLSSDESALQTSNTRTTLRKAKP